MTASAGHHTRPVSLRRRVATFQPARTDDLKPDALEHVGETFEWRGLWVVTEDDGGPYVGQTVWERADESLPWFGWVPDEDLVDVDEIHSHGPGCDPATGVREIPRRACSPVTIR